jgi:hypothetical protein
VSHPASKPFPAVTARLPRQPARAETVGSLLRPPALRQAIAEVYDPGHTALLAQERAKDLSHLHDVEDAAIAEAVQRQIAAGLDVVTDGEFRRYMFTNSFYDAVEGMEPSSAMISFVDERGDRIWSRCCRPGPCRRRSSRPGGCATCGPDRNIWLPAPTASWRPRSGARWPD